MSREREGEGGGRIIREVFFFLIVVRKRLFIKKL